MEKTVCYFTGKDESVMYKLEMNDEHTLGNVTTLKEGDDKVFRFAGDVHSFEMEENNPYDSSGVRGLYGAYNIMEQYTGDNITSIEWKMTSDDGKTHSFYFSDGLLKEYLDGKPVNKVLETNYLFEAYKYATQMLKIYGDTPICSGKDKADNVTFAAYASPDPDVYNILAYSEDEYGISIENTYTFLDEYTSVEDAVKAVETYISSNGYNRISDLDFTVDDEDKTVTLNISYNGDKDDESYSYSFEDYCNEIGINTAVYHNQSLLNDTRLETEKEYTEFLWSKERDNFVFDAKNWIRDDLSYKAFHPIDLERIDEKRDEDDKFKLTPNPLAQKSKDKAKDTMTLD